MPLTNLGKVRECLEIVGKGLFTEWEVNFLRDMEQKLQDRLFKPSPKQQRKIDDLYEKVCKSPY